jgi:putative oxidoreductase
MRSLNALTSSPGRCSHWYRAAAVSVGAGGKLVPTTFGGHRFWELGDASQRAQQQMHFLKNAAILRGLLVVALD